MLFKRIKKKKKKTVGIHPTDFHKDFLKTNIEFDIEQLTTSYLTRVCGL